MEDDWIRILYGSTAAYGTGTAHTETFLQTNGKALETSVTRREAIKNVFAWLFNF